MSTSEPDDLQDNSGISCKQGHSPQNHLYNTSPPTETHRRLMGLIKRKVNIHTLLTRAHESPPSKRPVWVVFFWYVIEFIASASGSGSGGFDRNSLPGRCVTLLVILVIALVITLIFRGST